MTTARALIDRLGLQPHPEGGWYAETWRAPAAEGERAASTAIHFLLEAGQSSHWHRVDAAEIWLWHAGDPVLLSLSADDTGPAETVILGGDVLAGQYVQQVIPPHWWQAARPAGGPAGYALVSCVVAPGFEFDGFELAPAGWGPGG
jgi:predicted cupin superfamily sugar epimerase